MGHPVGTVGEQGMTGVGVAHIHVDEGELGRQFGVGHE